MRRRNLLWVAPCIVLGLSACMTFRPAPGPMRLDTAKACADWRWIGITSKPEVQCPQVPGWTVTPLFGQVAPPPNACKSGYENEQGFDVIRELNRFCVYETAGKKSGALAFPPAVSADLVRFDRDCAALSLSLDADLKANPWKSSYEDFQDLLPQAGQPEKLRIEGRPGVRLAFLDTQPTHKGVPQEWWHSRHGYTLARMAKHLVCSPDSRYSCAAQITTQLALPIVRFDPEQKWEDKGIDRDRGGYLGFQSDLAEAIWNEVGDWQKDPRDGSPRHLVLNLSLAWDGELFGGLDEERIADMRAGTQAVYRALQYAARFDVLVLASAGNQKREPCANDGPLLPAAWEEGGPKEESCGEPRKGPLLYGVAGVRADDTLLANARASGMPPRAAYGETAIFSGSSVATAVASSIAAVVWNAFPDRSSREIMQILDESGKELDYPADFWFRGSPHPTSRITKVRRLSLCDALVKAKEDDCHRKGLSTCPGQFACKSRPMSSGPTAAAIPGSCQPWLWPQPEEVPFPFGPPRYQ